jgi:hypothetical protein
VAAKSAPSIETFVSVDGGFWLFDDAVVGCNLGYMVCTVAHAGTFIGQFRK